ncbi:hypothetical protein FB45DRAFT_899054 [Roridomyces roridus]|uniref:Uncharacterized protein n=1 Tax=Roridomyces roridus TaxID=1738132 RepID=A0AAD7FVJ8_9AGAR|nr:hypothetical protein FB45DRAFT_899054 [Roridomyces roridus]
MRDGFLWDGKKARIAHRTMNLPLLEGGKQILDIESRNEAIDLWNLKEFLKDDNERENWAYFAESTITHRWNTSQPDNKQGTLRRLFLQNIRIPNWRTNQLAYDLRRMIQTARKYNLEFTGLSISKDIRLQMPIWSHVGVRDITPTRWGIS